jgi:hypothetical protein
MKRKLKADKLLLNTKSSMYYRTLEKDKEYRGIRYFRVLMHDRLVIQVCLYAGETKKGRGSFTVGVNIISHITFLSNYAMGNYVESCTKAQYEKAFNQLISILK